MSAEFTDRGFHDDSLKLRVKIGKEKKRTLEYTLD